jgi:drug/metabolite transporter (DMT)-like permease
MRDALLVVVSGVTLSFHFLAFIFAVEFTTVANATFLVNTSPIMLAVLSPVLIRERTTSREGAGVLTATLGILLVANVGNGFRSFGFADVSALLAAALLSLYSLIGRYFRARGVSTAAYTAYVYSTATIVALSLADILGSKTFRTYDITNIIAILGLALVPTTLGHTLYNYSLGSVKALTANLFPLLEPILASMFAVLLFGEIPTLTQIVGYVLILSAVVIVVMSSSVEQQAKALS